ncbi:unnamed protein product [Ixodes persulcatus]
MRSSSILFIQVTLLILSTTSLCDPTMKEIKCEVCRALVKESVDLIAKADPKKKVPVGSFRLRGDGTQEQKMVLYAGSETHMHDLLEQVCSSLDNYAQATHKENGELILVNLNKDIGKLSTYQVLANPDENGKLRKLCEDMLGEFEDEYIRVFSKQKVRVEPQAFKLFCEGNEDICESRATKQEL